MNFASKIPKSLHEKTLTTMLSSFPDSELENLIEIIKKEQVRRNEKKTSN